jgi:hypothetical protein
VQAFWLREFSSYSPDFRNEVIAPLQNKLGSFLAVPPLRNILGQRVNLFDLRMLMDRGHVFIANLSKGELGEDSSALLGSILLTRFLLAALARADTPEEERRPFSIYVDEFPSFAAPSTLSTLLSEGKYATGSAAHQHSHIFPTRPGRLGTSASPRFRFRQALTTSPEFEPTFTREHLTNLDRHHFLLRQTGTPRPSSRAHRAGSFRTGSPRRLLLRTRGVMHGPGAYRSRRRNVCDQYTLDLDAPSYNT